MMTPLQLLAPARDAEIARIALMHGADAIYIGGPSHGARAAASNTLEDIESTVRLAHGFGARVYVTLNTLVYENEIPAVERLVWDFWRIGVDALIIQDMGLLRMHLPPIALHASTQCDIRTPEKARFLADCGFGQLVLPREFSLEEIQAVRQAVPAEVTLEAFVHGALCVSYSGDCQASCVANGRSANRGECAQMCRMAYDLIDGNGRVLKKDSHLLSLRDLNRLADLEALAQAGIASFKIEGRLKDAAYVKNVVASYRRAIDTLISKYPELYCHASLGSTKLSFEPDVNRAFNRGFTRYFLTCSSAKGSQLSQSPKWIGSPVGTVVKASAKMLTASLTAELVNGDGLGYFNNKGEFVGFRLNRIEGNLLFPAQPVEIAPGTELYRNSDRKRDLELAGDTAQRTIPVDMELNWPLSLTLRYGIKEGRKGMISVTGECPLQEARTEQKEARARALSKLGGTNYCLQSYKDNVDSMLFIPASVLSELRRKAVALLDSQILATHEYEKRLPERDSAMPYTTLTYHDNVANSLAEKFYRAHGVHSIEPAMEKLHASNYKLQGDSARGPGAGMPVMTTRYCLRRELGACLKENGANKISGPLYLKNKAASYRLDFDCAHCQMKLVPVT